jgi:hypothetical protein
MSVIKFLFPHPKPVDIAIELIGWIGMFMIVGAFFANTNDIWDQKSLIYLSVNTFGSVGLIVVSVYKRAYQPALLNIIWTIISVVALAQSIP